MKRTIGGMYSAQELEQRRYSKDVRNFKKWCLENNITYYTHEQADEEDVCVLSKSEYEIFESRHDLQTDNQSYFLSPENYEDWYEYFHKAE